MNNTFTLTLAPIRKAAIKASVGGPRKVEFACRSLLNGQPNPYRDDDTRGVVTNLIDVNADQTDLFESRTEGSRLKVEASSAHPGCAIVECWTYSTGFYGELQDTVYVGVVRGHVVGASCHFAKVFAAVLAAEVAAK